MGTIPSHLWLKLDRARKHMDEFEAEAAAFASELPKPYTITPESNPNSGKEQWRVRITRQPDPSLSVIIGDCVHNIRSSLDHLVFALSTGKGREKRNTAFPIHSHADEFTCKGKPAIRTLPPECQALIESLQPYQAENPIGRQLGRLNRIWNMDKHRELLLVATRPTALVVKYSGSRQLPAAPVDHRWNPPDKDEVVIPVTVIPGDLANQELKPDITFEICLRYTGTPVTRVLSDLYQAVRETVFPLFEPFF